MDYYFLHVLVQGRWMPMAGSPVLKAVKTRAEENFAHANLRWKKQGDEWHEVHGRYVIRKGNVGGDGE